MFCINPLRSTLIGIDIQSHEIRIMVLSHTKKSIRIEKMGYQALPEGAIQNGKIKIFKEVCATLAKLTAEMRVHKGAVAIAMPAASVVNKSIPALPLKHAALDAEVAAHLKTYFPGVTEDLCYDYIKLNPQSLLIVAARSAEVMPYINLVEQVGLQVKIVDVDLYAVLRAVTFAIAKKLQTLVILHFSAMKVEWILFHDSETLFYQQWPMDIDIALQCKSAFQLCSITHSTVLIQEIFLTGNKDKARAVSHAIEALLKIKTHLPDPFVHLAFPPQSACPSRFIVALGLALRNKA